MNLTVSEPDDQRISVRPDCGGLWRRACLYFQRRKVPTRRCSLRIQAMVSNRHPTLPPRHIVPRGISATPGFRSGSAPGKSAIPASVAGEGGRGPFGPRTGSSSGMRPGNSSGRGDSPGSRIGGGTSGRGLPGGLSCGGSDGCPGLIGGSSCGSIGISLFSGISIRDQRRGGGNVPCRSYPRSNSVLLRVLPVSA
jgi:hypothetical protein